MSVFGLQHGSVIARGRPATCAFGSTMPNCVRKAQHQQRTMLLTTTARQTAAMARKPMMDAWLVKNRIRRYRKNLQAQGSTVESQSDGRRIWCGTGERALGCYYDCPRMDDGSRRFPSVSKAAKSLLLDHFLN